VLTIGDFSRMTQLSIKTLRHYHDVGLVVPQRVDPDTGYRYYGPAQLPTAALVRRLRALDMPVAEVGAVLAAEPAERDAVIGAHLARLEARLASTQAAVASLRTMLASSAGPAVSHRSVPAQPSIAVHAVVDRDDLGEWFVETVTGLVTIADDMGRTGPPGGLFGFEVFAADRGPVTAFVPVAGAAAEFVVPAAELVVVTHRGSHDDVDLAYSALGVRATSRGISAEAPLREYYECFAWDTDDQSQWRTELCWPVHA
jgi:DNA-binding transcriptional MerR regulator